MHMRTDTATALLREATHRGYLIERPGQSVVFRAFHDWCVARGQPVVYIDRTRTKGQGAYVAVGIDVFATGERFRPVVLDEARQLLDDYPLMMRTRIAGMVTLSPLAIRHSQVPVDQAEDLALTLLALYRRMKETTV
jgi:hypothetical protein